MKMRRLLALLLCLLTLLLCTVSAYAVDQEAAEEDEEDDDTIKVTDVLLGRESISALFEQVFEQTIGKWLVGILNSAIEKLDSLVFNNMRQAFRIEKVFDRNPSGDVLTTPTLEQLYNFIYGIAIALVTIKFLFKGFQIYVLWRNGDADASPRDMLIGAIVAEVIMIGFPFLYVKAVDIAEWIVTSILSYLGGASISVPASALSVANYTAGLFLTVIFILIWAIMAFVLWVRVMMQGIELLILRVGLPLATLGLIDSDMALFKNYLQVVLKTFLTLIIQIALMSVSMRLVMTGQSDATYMLFGIAVMCVAMTTPKLLQQFLVPQQGSGALQKASSVAMLARSVKALVA